MSIYTRRRHNTALAQKAIFLKCGTIYTLASASMRHVNNMLAICKRKTSFMYVSCTIHANHRTYWQHFFIRALELNIYIVTSDRSIVINNIAAVVLLFENLHSGMHNWMRDCAGSMSQSLYSYTRVIACVVTNRAKQSINIYMNNSQCNT